MDRITGQNYIIVDGKRQFTNGPPATTIPADFLNAIQEEIMTVIAAAGITPNGSIYTQLLDALNYLISLKVLGGRGYAMGGNTGAVSAEIDGLQFSDEIAINPAAVLSVARVDTAGVNSSIRGYAMGGSAGAYSAEIDGLQFSDETAINPIAVLSVARYGLAGVNSSIRGYAMGGSAGAYSTEMTAYNSAMRLLLIQ